MKLIESLEKECSERDDDDCFLTYSDYESLIESFEVEICITVHDNNYQGDSRYILKNDNGSYGFLIFGWGSCRGCDALQACGSKQEIYELRDQLWNEIKWGSFYELLSYIENRDWELQYYWNDDKTKDFVKQAVELLSKIAGCKSEPIIKKIFAKENADL